MHKEIFIFGAGNGLGAAVAHELRRFPYTIIPFNKETVDVSRETQVAEVISGNKIENAVIFANINHDCMLHKLNSADHDEKWREQANFNILHLTNLVTLLLAEMRKRKSGNIIIASSVVVKRPVIGTGIYAACKAYWESMVKTIAIENASLGVRANCVRMGYMDAGLTHKINPTLKQKIKLDIPSGKFGLPEDAARTIDWILRTEYVNGSSIEITGGL